MRTRSCALCGAEFTLPRKSERKYCSKTCRDKAFAQQYYRKGSSLRRCHDCGKPTSDYRCKDCWEKYRSNDIWETFDERYTDFS